MVNPANAWVIIVTVVGSKWRIPMVWLKIQRNVHFPNSLRDHPDNTGSGNSPWAWQGRLGSNGGGGAGGFHLRKKYDPVTYVKEYYNSLPSMP